MKRLLDGNSDHFERSLLQAGSEVQPDPAAKRRLLTALAAGTLAASAGGGASYAATTPWWKALLATKVGKATLVGLAVAGSGTAVVALRAPVEPAAGASVSASVTAPSTQLPHVAARPAAENVVRDATSTSPPSPEVNVTPKVVAPGAHTQVRVHTTKTDRHEKSAPATEPSGPSAIVLEARLVERLRSAVHAGQAATVHDLLAEYRRSFPAGQLRPEVNKLETQWRAR